MRQPRVREIDIQQACCDLLALDGWRRLRCETVSRREWGKGFGEKGMADDLFLRYVPLKPNPYERIPGGYRGDRPDLMRERPLAEIIWIEWKAPGGKPKPHQIAWHRDERLRGAVTLIAGQDFPTSVDGFLEWYRGSGLMRRPL